MEREIEGLLRELTLEEKIGMIHGAALFHTKGVDRLGIPPLYMSDGPMGVREEYADDSWQRLNRAEDAVSYLPSNSAIASTWNREIARKSGDVLGAEARGRGKDMILAPGINIKRNPLCGRNFEYMSEDPYLVSEMTVPLVQGIQSHDISACVKHFAANSQETERLWVDTIVDERTLQEIYFPGFRAAVEKGGAFSLMGAYNLLNGEHCCTSRSLIDGVLRDAWGFDGVVVSDWGGVHDTTLAAQSSLDIEMDVVSDFDHHHMAEPLLERIRAGEIAEEAVDRKVRNILRLMLRLKMIGQKKAERSKGARNTPEHKAAVLAAAEESVILLKNAANILPLNPNSCGKVAVIGANADTVHADGGGSAEIKALYEVTPLAGIQSLLPDGVQVSFAPGYKVPEQVNESNTSWQADSTKKSDKAILLQEEADAEYRAEALRLARESDTVIFVGGLNHEYDVEGADRQDMKLPYGQDELIRALLEERPDTVIVLYAGSPVEMPWLMDAKTVLWSYYAGMEGGTALAEILFGKINPSGKLAETFLRSVEQCPARQDVTFGREDRVVYEEGIMMGYRHYDTCGDAVNFCFGHGLSYTTFHYCDLQVAKSGGEELSVSLTVTNTGEREGREAVQLYIAPHSDAGIPRPSHQLRGFEKVRLASGQSCRVEFSLTEKDFSCYDTTKKAFVPIPGDYEIEIGASSRDIRLTAAVKL